MKIVRGNMKVIVQFTSSPLGEGVSVSKYVSMALKEIQKSGLKYQLTPMATILEADNCREALEAIFKAHEAIFRAGAKRVVTDIKIDDRRDEPRKMEDKVNKVLKELEKMPL
jgi:uncharacterized protein (TIGR00106 family)